VSGVSIQMESAGEKKNRRFLAKAAVEMLFALVV
jgi:hypothetical protein